MLQRLLLMLAGGHDDYERRMLATEEDLHLDVLKKFVPTRFKESIQ